MKKNMMMAAAGAMMMTAAMSFPVYASQGQEVFAYLKNND